MTCDQTQPLLNAFAAHELGWGTAWRVRRHLAACPACTAELAETRRLDSRVRAWRDVSAPAGLQSRIANALPSAPPVSAPRRPATARRVVVGLAGMAAAGAAFFWLTPGQPGRPTIAFADVEQAMQQVQMVSFDFNSYVYDAQGHLIPSATTFSQRVWLRRTPAARAYLDRKMSELNLKDGRGYLSHSLKKGLYLKRPHDGKVPVAQDVARQLGEFIEAPTDADVLANPAMGWAFTPWQQQRVILNGMTCLKFTRTITHPISDDGRGIMSKRRGITHGNIWVDAKTLHVIHIENTGDASFMNKGYRERTVFDNFHYDETPPPGVFDWSPPAGAKVEGHW